MGTEANAPAARKSNATLKVRLGAGVSIDLRAEAKRRGVEYDEFAAEIIDAVVNNKLYAAVLDQ
ncbi:hypothetical protein [Bradyrhizobium erythrophlei]|uniref:hypothetical protein n=1 Tax=Bradyrhizobium erythrophlei TaxID=1437360 RepID=UPI0009A5A2BA|nr:hypothetical protein [Bradyrhizobium erythrophlei]